MQRELFGRTIMSISFNENEIINNILFLHCDGDIELDPTYSVGNFYKKLKQPKYKFDLEPQSKDVIQADCRKLPIKSKTIKTIMFDPPFLIDYERENVGNIKKRFSFYKNFDELYKFYYDSMLEFSRILKIGGILIFKCQDAKYSKNHFSHSEIYNMSLKLNYEPLDLFILLAKSRMIASNGGQQKSARKFHSYFWVFKKKKASRMLATDKINDATLLQENLCECG